MLALERNSQYLHFIYKNASRNNALYNYSFESICFVPNSSIVRPVVGSVFFLWQSLLDEDGIFHKCLISGPDSS